MCTLCMYIHVHTYVQHIIICTIYVHVCRCLAYSYQERLVPVYLATLRVFRVFRPMRAIRMSALFVCTYKNAAYIHVATYVHFSQYSMASSMYIVHDRGVFGGRGQGGFTPIESACPPRIPPDPQIPECLTLPPPQLHFSMHPFVYVGRHVYPQVKAVVSIHR